MPRSALEVATRGARCECADAVPGDAGVGAASSSFRAAAHQRVHRRACPGSGRTAGRAAGHDALAGARGAVSLPGGAGCERAARRQRWRRRHGRRCGPR
eukprot:338202-Chlamydomonas_euryale.AAC.1